jgi:hypothetical protein
VQYRRIVKACQPAYLVAKRRDKPRVAAAIVRVIRSRSGRFLKKDSKDNMWRDVGNNKAREKSSQALREGAPELRSLVQLPDQGSAQQQAGEAASVASTKLAPASFLYVHESTGQQIERNVDGRLMSGSPRMVQYGSFAGSGGPQSVGPPWAASPASNPSAETQPLTGQSQDVYQQAIQHYQQLCGNKRPVPSETLSDGGKKQRTDAKDDNITQPVDIPV